MSRRRGVLWRLMRRCLRLRPQARARLAALEHRLALKDQEVRSLESIVEAQRDAIQAWGWQRRAEGAEAMAYTEFLRAGGTER